MIGEFCKASRTRDGETREEVLSPYCPPRTEQAFLA